MEKFIAVPTQPQGLTRQISKNYRLLKIMQRKVYRILVIQLVTPHAIKEKR